MNILLANLAADTAGSGDVLAALASVLRARGHRPLIADAAELVPLSAILEAAERSSLAFRYSAAGCGSDPAVIVIATRDLFPLRETMPGLTRSVVAAFIVREEAGQAVRPYAPAGRLLPSQRLEAHLQLLDRPLADGTELLWLNSVIEEFVLTVLGPAEFLRHFQWRSNLRLREEHFGGLLFVPETSQIIELGREGFQAVQRALALNQPQTLAGDLVTDPLAIIGALAAAGALTTPTEDRP
jgi:hypothetical protein